MLGEYENREDGLVVNTGWAKFIKAQIEKSGFSEKEFSELVGVVPSTVRNWTVNGYTPNVDSLLKISEVLNVPPSTLFKESGFPTWWASASHQPVRIVAKAAHQAKLTTEQADQVAAYIAELVK